MAISTNDITRAGPGGNNEWAVNASSGNASGGEIVKADPGSGYSLCLEYLEINCAADDTVTIREDATIILGPFTFKAAAPVPIVLRFKKDGGELGEGNIILTANKELQVITGSSNAVQVYVEGRTLKL